MKAPRIYAKWKTVWIRGRAGEFYWIKNEMITNTILYMALIVVAILFLHSIKDNISTEWLRKVIWNWVLSPKRIMRWCERKGFETDINEDGFILLTQEGKTHYYYIYRKYPYVIFSEGGKINEDLDKEVIQTAIKEYNNMSRPVKIVVTENDTVNLILNGCDPIPWNFYQSFDWFLSAFESAEQELESIYQEFKDKSENPT